MRSWISQVYRSFSASRTKDKPRFAYQRHFLHQEEEDKQGRDEDSEEDDIDEEVLHEHILELES